MKEVLEELKIYLSWLKEMGINSVYLLPEQRKMLEKLSSKQQLLQEIKIELGDCKRCELWKTRHKIVFGEGPAEAKVVLVGEAPGHEEDLQGKPFVGAAGELLTKMLKAIGLSREEIYITNVVKCIKPSVICTLGSIATHTLLQKDIPISHLRGRVHLWQGIKLIPTFHPAYLLRNPGSKKLAWEDLKLLKKVLEKSI